MKNLLPIAIIAVFGLLSFGSCKKSSSSSSCTCKWISPTTNKDTSFSFSNVAPTYTSLTQECDTLNSVYKLAGSGYGCSM